MTENMKSEKAKFIIKFWYKSGKKIIFIKND